MKIAITTVQVPFISGGAELHAQNLKYALSTYGHEVDIITMPFWFSPNSLLEKYQSRWENEDLTDYLSGSIEKVICLKYPTYYVRHHNKSLWLLHPLSGYYDFFNSPYGASSGDREQDDFRRQLIQSDQAAFNCIKNRKTVSRYLAGSLSEISGVTFDPLYHPPPEPDVYRLEGSHPFIFAPSRLEEQKRHNLIIQAMQSVDPSLHLVIAGDGGQGPNLKNLARECGVEDRIIFLGDTERKVMASYYANCFAVYFGPFSEPYGYVTLEAMLSSKPVITCSDSGCPTELVHSGETGMVVQPTPQSISDAINTLWDSSAQAYGMGRAARDLYQSLGLNWRTVAEALVD